MRAGLWWLALCVPALAWAKGPAPTFSPADGWTADGQFFVHERVFTDFDNLPDADEPVVICEGVVRDVYPSGAARPSQSFVVAQKGKRCQGTGKPLAGFAAFAKAHPMGDVAGAVGPQGSTLVATEVTNAALREVKGTFVAGYVGEDDPQGQSGSFTPAVKRKDGALYKLEAFGCSWSGAMAAHCDYALQPHWRPDESVVAIVRHSVEGNMRSSETVNSVRFVTFGPRVKVLGYDLKKQKPSVAVARDVAATLGPPLHVTVGETKDPRTETVVYFATGFDAEAAKLAAQLHCKAEPLTWKADTDLVLAAVGAPK
jgi:hypothetical protein